MTGVHQLKQNRQVYSVEKGADAVTLIKPTKVAVQYPFRGDVSPLLPVSKTPLFQLCPLTGR